jgi:hypothetical protein
VIIKGIDPVCLDKAAIAGSAGNCCLSAKPAFVGGFFGQFYKTIRIDNRPLFKNKSRNTEGWYKWLYKSRSKHGMVF